MTTDPAANVDAAYQAALQPLTAQQRRFVAAYLDCLNASEAARRAGYKTKANVQGARLLAYASIQAAVAAGTARYAMPASEVLARLAAIARGSLADVLRLPAPTTREDGTTYTVGSDWALDLVKARETGAIHLIKKLKATKYGDEVELHDPVPALTLIGKQHGLFKEQGMQLNLDMSTLTTEQLERIAAGENPLHVLRRAE
ncbi:MAG TPA: terminase small subunit [Kouleothrix sp.]|uniref:terminase small subunit n=1 Tax=Kouleothrix sp. TaxID=2779161 RepID=UPI002C14CD20|nr:terminase small subunit [Kouleothrix sp.]